jgi:CheY-like chemotaxis protein
MSPSHDSINAREDGKLRILVVDDEPTLRLGFAYALTSRTTVVETAATGRIALDRIAEDRFDVIILDLRMPDLDGVGVIETLRSEGNTIPIILCSAALSPVAALKAIRHGVVDFLLKPVRPVDLRQVVEHVLSPEQRPFPQAMKLARNGQTAEAIQMLETQEIPSRQAKHWLDLLKSIRDAELDGEIAHLEDAMRANLSILAFNAPTVG